VIVESLLAENTDYKFHCSDGHISFVQIISQRQASSGPLETIVDAKGNLMRRHLDHKMRPSSAPPAIPATWQRMCDIADLISKHFKFCRVDLYTDEEDVFLGEITFWPLSGYYQTDDNLMLGEMIGFDAEPQPPVVT
jgi:hypothetical protein